MEKKIAGNIDEYIAGYPDNVQAIMQKLRVTIKRAAPKAEETIKYGMPTFMLNGNLVYFAGAKKHIGFYPVPSTGSDKFNQELAPFRAAKSSLQFPFDKPVPYGLISRIVKLRVKENAERAKAKEAPKAATKSRPTAKAKKK